MLSVLCSYYHRIDEIIYHFVLPQITWKFKIYLIFFIIKVIISFNLRFSDKSKIQFSLQKFVLLSLVVVKNSDANFIFIVMFKHKLKYACCKKVVEVIISYENAVVAYLSDVSLISLSKTIIYYSSLTGIKFQKKK